MQLETGMRPRYVASEAVFGLRAEGVSKHMPSVSEFKTEI